MKNLALCTGLSALFTTLCISFLTVLPNTFSTGLFIVICAGFIVFLFSLLTLLIEWSSKP